MKVASYCEPTEWNDFSGVVLSRINFKFLNKNLIQVIESSNPWITHIKKHSRNFYSLGYLKIFWLDFLNQSYPQI